MNSAPLRFLGMLFGILVWLACANAGATTVSTPPSARYVNPSFGCQIMHAVDLAATTPEQVAVALIAQMDPADCWRGAPPGLPGHGGFTKWTPGACTWNSGTWSCEFRCWYNVDCGSVSITFGAVCPTQSPLTGSACVFGGDASTGVAASDMIIGPTAHYSHAAFGCQILHPVNLSGATPEAVATALIAQMDPGDCWHGAPLGSPGHAGVNAYTPGNCTWSNGGWSCEFFCRWAGRDCGTFSLPLDAVCPSGWTASGAVCKLSNWATAGTRYAYDALGNLTQITDPLGNVTDQTYNALNQLTQIRQPAATSGGTRPTIAMTSDARGQLASVTDPRGLTTSYTVDGLGNRTVLTSPDTGTTTDTHDANGNVLTSTDARGKVTTYTYDALNRVSSVSYTTGTGIAYEYDGGTSPLANDLGRLTKITDETGSARYRYDGFGRILQKTWADPTNSRSRTVGYTWGTTGTLKGKLSGMTYPSGTGVAYTYDSAGRVASIVLSLASNGGVSTVTLLSDLKYDGTGQPSSWTWGNGALYSRTLDVQGRLASFPLGVVSAGSSAGVTPSALTRTLGYDAASRITAMTHADTASSTSSSPAVAANTTTAYDNLSRLTSYVSASASQSYGYDLTGNRTQWTVGGTSYTNTIDNTSNRLTATSGPTPAQSNSYDATGNLTGDGTATLSYNDRGRLASSTQGGVTTSYAINGLGQRIVKSGSGVTSGKLVFVYDEAGHLLGEYDANNEAVSETIWLGDMPVGVVRGGGAGLVVDNSGAGVTVSGAWTTSTSGSDYLGANVLTREVGTDGDSVSWPLTIATTGTYNVYARWTAGTDRADSAQYAIETGSGIETVSVNQQANGGQWVLLRSVALTAGSRSVTLAQHAAGLVVADAVKAVPIGQDATTEYYVFSDQISTPRVIVRPGDNKMVWRWDGADPFGVAVPDENPEGLGGFAFNLRFAGQYFDGESGRFYNWHRDYEPRVGRYVESDPIGFAGGINSYLYVNANPVGYKDPSGLLLLHPSTIGAVIGGVAGAVQAANSGGGWASENAWNIVVGAATGAGAGALAGLLPGSAGVWAGIRVGAMSGAAGNAANQWMGGTSIDCTNLAQVGTQALIGAAGGGVGYSGGFSSALAILRAGGTARGAIAFGNIYGAVTGGATQVLSNLPIPTSLGGFRPDAGGCACS